MRYLFRITTVMRGAEEIPLGTTPPAALKLRGPHQFYAYLTRNEFSPAARAGPTVEKLLQPVGSIARQQPRVCAWSAAEVPLGPYAYFTAASVRYAERAPGS